VLVASAAAVLALQVAVKQLIATGGGDLFGLEISPNHKGVYLVDDAGSGSGANSLRPLF
jgi:hypothetical protein